MKKATEIPPGKPGMGTVGQPPKYDYERMLDGNVWELTRGEDFTILPANFAKVVRAYCAAHNIRATVAIRGDSVFVQAVR